MTNTHKDQARKALIFGEPKGFFDPFAPLESISTPLSSTLLAFRANLWSAFQVGNVPYQLVHMSVLDQRFHQLVTAERILCEIKIEDGEIAKDQADTVAAEIAGKKMSEELATRDVIKRHADQTLAILNQHLFSGGFRVSAQELLRQVLVLSWGAFEIFANDSLRVLLNERPKVVRAFADNRNYRDFLSAATLMEALENRDFNLSSAMGDVLCEAMKLDSLEKIRGAIHLALGEPSIDISLKDERLWRISQQRHLIVHRRGIIDTYYKNHTSDQWEIGEHLTLDAPYIVENLVFVRDVGCSLFQAMQKKLMG
jgi:hypothetical protein